MTGQMSLSIQEARLHQRPGPHGESDRDSNEQRNGGSGREALEARLQGPVAPRDDRGYRGEGTCKRQDRSPEKGVRTIAGLECR